MQTSTNHSHYDRNYFSWQKKTGEFCGLANKVKFEEFASSEINLLDFGCGGGFMLKNLAAKNKMGVEINPSARTMASQNGIKVFEKTEEVPDAWADLVISDNALEHTGSPLEEITKLYTKVRPGGLAVFVVPCEHLEFSYKPNDINQHLYSWSPMALGNLFTHAGFEVVSCEPFFHKHIPYSHRIRPLIGETLFNLSCRMNGLINRRKWNEVRIIARKAI